MSLELEVALAYLRSRPSRLVSAVSLLAIGGIALGVAALVVAMGLLSGYRTEIREKLIGANAEVVVYPLTATSPAEVMALERRLAGVAGVEATAPVVYQTGLAASAATPDGTDAILKGIDAAAEASVSPQMRAYLPGAAALAPSGGLPGAALGVELARRLDVREGDVVTLSVPDASGGQVRFVPRTGRFRVARIFRSNFAEYDAEWVFCDREALRALSRMSGGANVIEVKLDTTRDREKAEGLIRDAAGAKFSVADTLSMNRGLFSALRVQQTTLFLVIGLIVAVSTFNVVATLVMTVQEKRRDIGILSSLGAEPRFFSRAFLWFGVLLGSAGIVAGVVFGSLVCWVVTTFRLLRFPPGVAEIYFVSSIPFRVRPLDLGAIVLFSAAAILLASWVPARRAARVDIAEALRYE
ncbi:MAG TPA: ABC transporter permease [Thermoanaerobaculia bacterium]|nr:ABC transporter permease [Thermoanaerobaculia bacterium]